MKKLAFLSSLIFLTATQIVSAESTISNIEKTKTLRVCEAADDPWATIDPATGDWQGLTVDLVKAFAESMEAKVEITDAGWSGLVQSLATGKCDIAAAPMFATIPRGKLVLFTKPFAAEGQAAIVKQDSTMHKFADLDQAGKVLVGSAGSATNEFAKRFFKNATIKDAATSDSMEIMADVAAGRVDAAWLSYTSQSLVLQANPGLGVRFLGEAPIGFSPIRWAVPAGEYQFQQLVDIWIEDAINSGVAEEHWNKWFPGVSYQMKAK